MKVTHSQVIAHRRREGGLLVERGQGHTDSTRAASWLEESEVVHARHLVVELPDIEADARRESSAARGLPMGDEAVLPTLVR